MSRHFVILSYMMNSASRGGFWGSIVTDHRKLLLLLGFDGDDGEKAIVTGEESPRGSLGLRDHNW